VREELELPLFRICDTIGVTRIMRGCTRQGLIQPMDDMTTLSAAEEPLEQSEPVAESPGSEPVPPDTPSAEMMGGEEGTPRRVRVRVRTNWLATILVGIVMFVLGGLGGYVGRPIISPPPPTPTPAAAQAQPANMQALLTMLISKTRHFEGSPNAPVTILEFGDFQ
jgi:hypothetical protein